MTILRLDLETYSPVDLFKTGVYPYAEHPDFEILLFGYAFDSDPVTVVDLARGEELPRDVRVALTDHTTLKVAYNAQFERICLSRYLHTSEYLPPETWRCTQVHGLYLGLPGNLLQLSQVVLADKDREKMETGKDLISYFCKPCKATKTNGGRTRNLPHHAPEKWQQFVDYNLRDVEAERAVSLILGRRPVPSAVWDEYHLDQRINDRGVRVDRELVARAIECDRINKEALRREAIELTGLVNPGSVQQMSAWLVDEHTVFVESLDKETVKDLLKTSDDAVLTRALELRQEMSKSSVKKYAAMDAAMCKDGRIRGLLQFYGANRTGRWAGRLVQVQNLPQNHLPDLEDARSMLKAGDYETIEMLHGSVQNVLSQLIRTAFVPAAGCVFLISDFSAIEARVIAWLAGEEWRMEVFRTHGKIYEASASAMFHVPVEQITKGNPLRQKGKIAELALGYQGSVGALITMGALKMGLTEADLPGLVSAWRKANPKIVQLWGDVETAAMAAVHEGTEEKVGPLTFYCDGKRWLLCGLPSGRELAYAQPRIQPDGKFGRMSLTYEGMNQETKRWSRIPTYGGKLVENCLAGDTEVLTQDGWKAIVDIEATDLVHDGETWVSHDGLTHQGVRDTIEVNGVRMTPDHKILTESGWVCASSCEGHFRAKIRAFDGPALLRGERGEVALAGAVRLRNSEDDAGDRVPQGESEILRMPAGQSNIGAAHHARNVTPPSLCRLAIDGRSLHAADAPSLAQLRGSWHNSLRKLAEFVRGLLERCGLQLPRRLVSGPDRQRQGLLPGELPLDRCENAGPEQKDQRVHQHASRADDFGRSVGAFRDRDDDALLPAESGMARRPFVISAGRTEPVFDLINAGPRRRFIVRGSQEPFIVHNCVQAIARDCLSVAMTRCKDLRIVMHIHDEIVLEAPEILTEATECWVGEAMGDPISWAPDLPLRGDGFVTPFYRKED